MARIGINLGGDNWQESAKGAIAATHRYFRVIVRIYGDREQIASIDDASRKTLEIIDCPPNEVEQLKRSLEDLRDGRLDAVITATNSEDLVKSIVKTRVPREPGVRWPALIVPFPTLSPTKDEKNPFEDRMSYLIDGGASTRLEVLGLDVFPGWALTGCRFLAKYRGIARPRVGLLNIAKEKAFKALERIDERLRSSAFPGEYLGYVEAADFWFGGVDLLLADGFTGNNALKWTEGAFKVAYLKLVRGVDPRTKEGLKQKAEAMLSYDSYIISRLLGLEVPVFRVHGNAKSDHIARSFVLAKDQYHLE